MDSHKAFVVKYALHEDLDLSSHYDNAEVTVNVSLGKEFSEGSLYFAGFQQVPLLEKYPVLSMGGWGEWYKQIVLPIHKPIRETHQFPALTV